MIKIGLKEKRLKILEKELKRIVPQLIFSGVEKIILFGSLVNKKIDKLSNIDILIVKKTDKPFLERLTEYYTTLNPRCKIDIFVYTPEEFEVMKKENVFV